MKLYCNGTIYTMDQEKETVAAVLVDGNRIIDTFTEMPDIDAEVIDLKGGVMIPGLIDTHIHLVGTGLALNSVNFREDTAIEEVKRKIKAAADELPDDSWLVCEGYDENQLGYRITRDELDALTHAKVIVKRVCRHAAVVNSAAFEALGIDDNVRNMEGGQFEKVAGRLNGWVHDKVMDLFVEESLNVTEQSLIYAMEVAADAMHGVGLTAIHTEDLGYYKDYKKVLAAYRHVFGKGKRQLRLNLLRHTTIIEAMEQEDAAFDTWLKKDAMKFYADGALGGRTALFKAPYADDPATYGLAIYTEEQLEEEVKKARALNTTIAVHMIGDRACEMVLDAIDKHPPEHGRDRLIHVSFLSEELIERMSRMAVICDVQPSFATSDFPWAIDRVGEDRAQFGYAWKSLLDHNITIGGGSDSPIEDFNPLVGISAAVTRRAKDGEVYFKAQQLSVYEALKLYTVNAADIAERPDNGRIKKGYIADFTILAEDPYEVSPDRIKDIQTTMTIVDGDIVYQR